MTLDGATTIWPDGTSWSGVLGALLLPDGTTVLEGQTVSGAGLSLPKSEAKAWLADPAGQPACPWTDEVRVFNPGSEVTLVASP